MYSTCLFCSGALGTNDVIEHFPVGRRLAFDAAKGRLWVVCRACERWNLTPLEERWEAIEQCERAFSGTRLRVSTDEIGLARLREGLELVRIGAPQRPEMAAWRYGDQFGRRRRRAILLGGAAAAGVAGFVIAGPVMGLLGGAGVSLLNFANLARTLYRNRTVAARIPGAGDQALVVQRDQVDKSRLTWDPRANFWSLDIAHRRSQRAGGSWWYYDDKELETSLRDDQALQAARQLLPAVNASGAGRSTVGDAVAYLEHATDPAMLFATAARDFARKPAWTSRTHEVLLRKLPAPVRLALEMSAHEESERRALEGELHLLEAEWKAAEEIAGIADDMFLPPAMEQSVRRLKGHHPS